MITVALPKGRLGKTVYSLLAEAGYFCGEFTPDTRKLVVEDRENGVRYLLVKPSDVGIYTEKGAADIGAVGADILIETEPDVYELADLKTGCCRLVVAAPVGFSDDSSNRLRVATKYVNVAKKHYAKTGREIEIIKLGGSIELAAVLGLADVIVDIVETGTTLKENNLEVITEIVPSSARIIANKISYKFKKEQIDEICRKIGE